MFPASKHRMHELGCARHNYFCEKSQMVVAKADKEEHEATMLVEAECEFCGAKMMAFQLVEHKKNCDQQPVKCKFFHLCGEMHPPGKMDEHLAICGTKTDKCPDCGEYVMRNDLRDHKQEGFCDAIKASKEEMNEEAAEAEKKRYQQNLLNNYNMSSEE